MTLAAISEIFGDVADKSEVCVGHALSLTTGASMGARLTGPHQASHRGIFRYMDIFTSRDTPGRGDLMILDFGEENIPEHATSLFILKTDTSTFIWYNNPWGYRDDNKLSLRQLKEFERDREERGLYPKLELRYRRIHHSKALMKQTDADSAAKAAYTEWARSGEEYSREEGMISPVHVVSAIQRLKLKHRKEHIVVIHPSVSMNEVGPQSLYDDGVKSSHHGVISCIRDKGGCVVWNELYATYAMVLVRNARKEGGDVSPGALMDIMRELRDGVLMGEKDAKETLGKFTFALTPSGWLKQYLVALFPMIPYEFLIVNKSEYYSNVRKVYEKGWKTAENDNGPGTVLNLLRAMTLGLAPGMDSLIARELRHYEYDRYKHSFKVREILNMTMLLLACKHGEYFRNLVILT